MKILSENGVDKRLCVVISLPASAARSLNFQVNPVLPRLRRWLVPAPPVRRGPGIMPSKWQVWGQPDGSIVWLPVSDAPPNPPRPGPLRPAPRHPPLPDEAPIEGSISINVYPCILVRINHGCVVNS